MMAQCKRSRSLLSSLCFPPASSLKPHKTSLPCRRTPRPWSSTPRPHPRLTQTTPPGRREKLELGTLFIPEKLHTKTPKLLFFFHGGDWLPQYAAAQQKDTAVITIQSGAGSSNYIRLFLDTKRFLALIAEAQAKSGLTFSEIDLAGWSAGCGAARQILHDQRFLRPRPRSPLHRRHPHRLRQRPPGPTESQINTDNLQIWIRFGQDAMAGKKRFIIVHSEIFPGTFASTTETTDYLLTQWHLSPHPVVKWGPMKTQMISEVNSGGLTVIGFAGNAAPDHVDLLNSLPDYLRWLAKK